MPRSKIAIQGNVQIWVHANDHNPPHCHVIWGQQEILIDLKDFTVLRKTGFKLVSDIRRVIGIVAENQDALLAQWREYHED